MCPESPPPSQMYREIVTPVEIPTEQCSSRDEKFYERDRSCDLQKHAPKRSYKRTEKNLHAGTEKNNTKFYKNTSYNKTISSSMEIKSQNNTSKKIDSENKNSSIYSNQKKTKLSINFDSSKVADVLKSPPLSEMDITNKLNQQVKTVFNQNNSSPSIFNDSSIEQKDTFIDINESKGSESVDLCQNNVKRSYFQAEDGNENAVESENQEILQKFVNILRQTNSNDLDIISKVLPKEKFLIVKSIIEKNKNKEQNTVEEPRDFVQNVKETNIPKKKTKKNELDRLNDDIRDVFISEGGLNVTGPRMCRMVTDLKLKKTIENESSQKNKAKVMITNIEDVLNKQTKNLKISNENNNCFVHSKTAEEEEYNLRAQKRKSILSANNIKNTDINWHSLSKYVNYCVLCKIRLTNTPNHYRLNHGEHYLSRLAPTVLHKLQNEEFGKAKFVEKCEKGIAIFHRCPFCLEYGTRRVNDWIDHFVRHTGEFLYECSVCGSGRNKSHKLKPHFRLFCKNAIHFKNEVVRVVNRSFKGYVCKMCKFVQMIRCNLERHIIEQHEIAISSEIIEDNTVVVNIMDWSTSIKVDRKQGKLLEEQYRNISPTRNCEDSEENKIEDDSEKNSEAIFLQLTKLCNQNKSDFEINIEKQNNTIVENMSLVMPTSRNSNDSPTIAFKRKLLNIVEDSDFCTQKTTSSERIAERVSKISKRFEEESKKEDSNAKNLVNVSEHNVESYTEKEIPEYQEYHTEELNNETDDENWEDIEENVQKNIKKGQTKLHSFYAINARKAKKLKSAYLQLTVFNKSKRDNSQTEDVPNINDISNLLDSKFDGLDTHSLINNMDVENANSVCINVENQHNSIGEAMEFETDHRQNLNSNTSCMTSFTQDKANPIIQRICHVGYTIDENYTCNFYCLSKTCKFVYSNEYFGLEMHCLSKHMSITWDGFCEVCQRQTKTAFMNKKYSIKDEMEHMFNCHIPIVHDTLISHDELAPEEPDKEKQTEQVTTTNLRITIRRLTGDCLSQSPQTLVGNENVKNLKRSSHCYEIIPQTDEILPPVPEISQNAQPAALLKTPVQKSTLKIAKVVNLHPSSNLLNSAPINDTATTTKTVTTTTTATTTTIATANKRPETEHEYIPDSRIYTCGASGCQYLTFTEEIFSLHISTLHKDATTYTCPFCNKELCKRGIVMQRIMFHLLFHSNKLFQCETCSFLNPLRTKVVRHIQEIHNSGGSINMIIHDRKNGPDFTVKIPVLSVSRNTINNSIRDAEITNTKKKRVHWHCNLCNMQTKTYNQMSSHSTTCHSMRFGFHCKICEYGCSRENSMSFHFENEHKDMTCSYTTVFRKI